MFRRLRNLILIGLALIAVAAAYRVVTAAQQQTSSQASSTPLDTAKVERGDVALTVSATGSIQANQAVSMTFGSTGKVTAINVAAGDHVRQGQTIATLDSTAANDAVLLAQAQVDAQQIALDQITAKPRQVDINVAQAQLDIAKAQLKEASSSGSKVQAQIAGLQVDLAKTQLWQTQLQRDADLAKKADLQSKGQSQQANSLPTDQQHNAALQSSEFDVQIAQSNLNASTSSGGSVSGIASGQAAVTSAQVALDNLLNGGNKDDIAKAQAQLQSAQYALDSAKANLAKTTLVAPFDGIVAQVNIHLGEAAPTTTAAVVLLDTSSFYVDVPVQETDISKIAVGQPVTLTVDALPGVTINGQVSQVAPTSTLSGNVVTYTVRVTADPAGQPLRSAMSSTATIITQAAKNVLRLPNRFITVTSGRATVNVLQPDGTNQPVPVTLGLRNTAYSEIKSGVSEGDVVVSATTTGTAGGSGNQGGGRGPGGFPGFGGRGPGG